MVPLSTGRMAPNRKLNPSAVLRAAWETKVTNFRLYLQGSGPRQRLYPMPISTLDGWHPEAHRAVLSVVATIASRSMIVFAMARGILFLRHPTLLITSNAACLLSGWYVLV